MTTEKQDRFHGCLLGLAVGDAVGTTVEFKPRGSFEPVTDMVGGGPFGLEPGQWTDDTSMALCQRFQICGPAGLMSEIVVKGGGLGAWKADRFGLIGCRCGAMNGCGLESFLHACCYPGANRICPMG